MPVCHTFMKQVQSGFFCLVGKESGFHTTYNVVLIKQFLTVVYRFEILISLFDHLNAVFVSCLSLLNKREAKRTRLHWRCRPRYELSHGVWHDCDGVVLSLRFLSTIVHLKFSYITLLQPWSQVLGVSCIVRKLVKFCMKYLVILKVVLWFRGWF
jgi:hypothetical protein